MGSHIVINKITKFKNYIIKLTDYRFKKSSKNPIGLKYSFVLIKDYVRILGYDNHENKRVECERTSVLARNSPHVHRGNKEYPYNFIDIETAIDDFYREVKKIIESDSNGKGKN